MLQANARGVTPITVDAIEGFLEALDCPRSLTVYLLYKNKEHDALARLEIDPMHYLHAEDFRLAYLATRFLAKADFLETTFNRTDVARRKFIECEVMCRDTNDRLVRLHRSNESIHLYGDMSLPFSDICQRITGKIASVLRTAPTIDVLRTCVFGPGSTTRVKGTKTSAYEKLQEPLHITQEALHILPNLYAEYPRLPRELCIAEGSDVTFVPKNAKTDRPIAIEPDLNIFSQLGVGDYIRESLRRVGVDLRDQTRNQRLACLGSVTGRLATIDMSSASDLISQGLCMYLLPVDWYILLDTLRSHKYRIEGRVYVFHKFSSMGNGFTFPLQSLVFWALAQVACDLTHAAEGDIGVYGDDVIIPVNASKAFISLLELFGLKVNSAKSFTSGPFRESCGKDYFNGIDCQPFYLKQQVADVEDVYKFYNSLVRLSQRLSVPGFRSSRFVGLCTLLRQRTPKGQHLLIPNGMGDGGFVSSLEEARPFIAGAPHGWEGYFFKCLIHSPKTYQMTDSKATLLYALYAAGSPTPSKGLASHRRRTWKKVRRVLASHWPALGDLLA